MNHGSAATFRGCRRALRHVPLMLSSLCSLPAPFNTATMATMRPRQGRLKTKRRTPSVFGHRLLLPCVWCDARWAGARQGSRTAAVSNAALSSLYQLGADVDVCYSAAAAQTHAAQNSPSPSPARARSCVPSSPSRTTAHNTPVQASCAGLPSRAYRLAHISPPTSHHLCLPRLLASPGLSLALGKLDPGRFIELARSSRRPAV
jgi:hypothetical protein